MFRQIVGVVCLSFILSGCFAKGEAPRSAPPARLSPRRLPQGQTLVIGAPERPSGGEQVSFQTVVARDQPVEFGLYSEARSVAWRVRVEHPSGGYVACRQETPRAQVGRCGPLVGGTRYQVIVEAPALGRAWLSVW